MPIKIGQIIPVAIQPTADITPDVVTDVPLDFVPTIDMEKPFELPANFDELSAEEQNAINLKYRFMGIRLKSSIRDRTIPLSKETMDLP